jgi:alkanesulfonate monooxygenase SsuD/methylene tetrahydromethanopterin reductase-like flavin-dependent oxidoreductase (luciferase family)
MKFGVHYLMSCASAQSPYVRYQDTITQSVLAEKLGFESVWPVEQHFNQIQSALPCPTLLLASIAVKTTNLRLGTAIIQLPLHHPMRTAEEIATLDVLSGGRVEFGVGRGSNPAHFAGFNIPLSESRDRMEESLGYIMKAFTEESFSFNGRFFAGEDLCLAPKPLQQPFPSVTIAANSADTARLAGRLGHPVFIALHVNPLAKAKELVSLYRETLQEYGHAQTNKITLLMPMFVASNDYAVRQAAEPAVEQFVNMMSMLLTTQANKWATQAESAMMHKLLERISQTTYQSMNQDIAAVFATPAECVGKLKFLQQELGVGRMICWFNLVGAIPVDKVTQSMKLFAEQVMPHFNE